MLGALMAYKTKPLQRQLKLLDVVAVADNHSIPSVAVGAIGTIVDELDHDFLLVEFADKQGRATSIEPIPAKDLALVD